MIRFSIVTNQQTPLDSKEQCQKDLGDSFMTDSMRSNVNNFSVSARKKRCDPKTPAELLNVRFMWAKTELASFIASPN